MSLWWLSVLRVCVCGCGQLVNKQKAWPRFWRPRCRKNSQISKVPPPLPHSLRLRPSLILHLRSCSTPLCVQTILRQRSFKARWTVNTTAHFSFFLSLFSPLSLSLSFTFFCLVSTSRLCLPLFPLCLFFLYPCPPCAPSLSRWNPWHRLASHDPLFHLRTHTHTVSLYLCVHSAFTPIHFLSFWTASTQNLRHNVPNSNLSLTPIHTFASKFKVVTLKFSNTSLFGQAKLSS